MFLEKLDNDLTAAQKAKDSLRVDTLRLLKSRLKNEQITAQGAGVQGDLPEDKIMAIISSEIKKRRDSVEAYTKGGRAELAKKEQDEIEILQTYLPEQLSEPEVAKIIEETLTGQSLSAADFGKAMGLVMAKLKGKADGTLISKLLKEKLK